MTLRIRTQARSLRRLLAACAAVGLIASFAQAQLKVQIIQPGPKAIAQADAADVAEKIDDPAELKRVFDGLIGDIASDDFAARQRASEKLTANEQFDLAMLETAMQRPGLSLEAHTRLFTIARQRFFRSPRAALGFQFGGMQLRDRVVVGVTYPPFECVKLLEEGDMIVGADGFKLEGPGARLLLQSIIISHEPGEIIKLVVRRGAQKLNIEVKLGSFSALPQGGGANLLEDRLSRAWRIRTQTKGAAGPEPIRVEGARPAPWGLSEDAAARKAARAFDRESNENAPKIVGGGTPRLVTNPDEARFEPATRQQFAILNGQNRMVNMPFIRAGFFGDIDPDDGRQPLDPTVERGMLLDARMQYDKRLNGVDSKKLSPTDPLYAESKARDLLNKQMDALQAEIDEVKAAAKDSGKHTAADANAPTAP